MGHVVHGLVRNHVLAADRRACCSTPRKCRPIRWGVMKSATTDIHVCRSTSPQRQESVRPLAEQPRQSAHLPSGTYKFAGRCLRVTVLAIALKAQKAAWQYQITSPGTMSEDGQAVSYSVSSMIALASSIEASRGYSYPGECLMSTRVGEPLLRCTMWRDSTRHDVTREVIFEGNGSWVFNWATSNQ